MNIIQFEEQLFKFLVDKLKDTNLLKTFLIVSNQKTERQLQIPAINGNFDEFCKKLYELFLDQYSAKEKC